jgi:hypothetical protein
MSGTTSRIQAIRDTEECRALEEIIERLMPNCADDRTTYMILHAMDRQGEMLGLYPVNNGVPS